jgi:Rieske Fe-S protein
VPKRSDTEDIVTAAADRPEQPARRRLLMSAAGAAVAGALARVGCAHREEASGQQQGPAGSAAPTTPVVVGKAADFPANAAPKVIEVPNPSSPGQTSTYIVENNGDGTFLVLSALCTHRGCPVAWQADLKQFVCPCHGGRYDKAGNVTYGAPPRSLTTFPSRIEGGNIVI